MGRRRLHATHFCPLCDVVCAWCEDCAKAHCLNGHEHDGFDGEDVVASGEVLTKLQEAGKVREPTERDW